MIRSRKQITASKATERHSNSQVQLNHIYREAPIGLCNLDTDLRYIWVNEWLAAINGFSVEQHLGRTIGEMLPDVAAGVESQLRQVIETGQPILEGTVEAETAAHPGETKSYQHSYYAVKSGDGRIIGVSCFVQDTTQRVRAEEELRQSEEKARSIVERAYDAFIAMNADGLITDWNPQAETTFGWPRSEAVGQLLVDTIIPARYREAHTQGMKHFLSTGEGPVLNKRIEMSALHRDGHEFPVELSISSARLGETYFFNAFVHDISERKRAEKELDNERASLEEKVQERTRELTNLSGRLIDAQEKERSRIARELHDDISQSLALISVELETLQDKPVKGNDIVAEKIGALLNRTRDVATDVHRLSHQLHPDALKFLGLPAAIRSYCNELSKKRNLAVEALLPNIPSTIPFDISLCLYRVVQEALQNVIKHSGTSQAFVELRRLPREILLIISDSGSGFDRKSGNNNRGIGIVSMQERVRLVGGVLRIQSNISEGTRVEVRIPLPSAATE